MEESEHGVGSLGQLQLDADEHYLAGKLLQGDHLRKVLRGVKSVINITLARYATTRVDLLSKAMAPQTITLIMRAV